MLGGWQVVPTVLDATGVTPELEYPLDGLSLLGNDERELLLLEHWTQPGKSVPDWAALRSQDYEYVEYYESSAPKGRSSE
jgi:hypothetical protein